MSGFKLLAIIPLKGCDEKYRKNLKIGFPYKFYQSHNIKLNDDFSEIISVNENATYKVPQELYQIKNGINISVSAVVGKNGTGKSTLIELLYLLIYLISTKKENGKTNVINKKSEDIKYYIEEELLSDSDTFSKIIKSSKLDISKLNEKDIPWIISIIKKHKLNINYNNISFEDLLLKVTNRLSDKKKETEHQLEQELKIEKHIDENFAIAVTYSINDVIYNISYCDKVLKFNKQTSEDSWTATSIDEVNFSELFYNISLNYSHHSLNSNNLGNWITKLFHKNDGYITPVVINPMRNNGNFDINKELNLSKERLMTNAVFNIINHKDYLLLGKYKIEKFVFSLKEKSFPIALNYADEDYFNRLISSSLLKEKVGITKIEKHIDYWDYAIEYLENKIPKIERNYSDIIYRENNADNTFNNFLLSDDSHITKKLRQVTNFLKMTLKEENGKFWKMPEGVKTITIDSSSLIEWVKLFNLDFKNTSPSELIEYALPGFFNIDFKLKDIEEIDGKEISFGDLSSGEQQMILNTNSILYHLYNLQSVHTSEEKIKKENQRIKYKNINVILDEVELYYHPEMQRLLISNLLKSFSNVKRKGEIGIESINICVLTHSPFILSDVPIQNVLRLQRKGTSKKVEFSNQTFGANIHELLTNSFFMESTIGAFALEKIREIIEFHYEIRIADTSKIELLTIEYYEKKEYYNFIVQNIGEELIKGVLENHIEFIEDNISY
jgi:predicted ATPase